MAMKTEPTESMVQSVGLGGALGSYNNPYCGQRYSPHPSYSSYNSYQPSGLTTGTTTGTHSANYWEQWSQVC